MIERNVYSWGVALRKGYHPAGYTFDPAQIPLGEYKVRLDFKIWSKKIMAVNCYFTMQDSDQLFVLCVYCNNKTGQYRLPGCGLDFTLCPLNKNYQITVAKNPLNTAVLKNAVLID